MTTQGRGLLAVWTDIEPAAEAEFNEWYDREHLGERAANPGFLNARRYGVVPAAPSYFAAYDTESLAVLGSPAYVHALRNQTAWSQRIFTHFRETTRMIAAQTANHGNGLGGAMLTLRLAPGGAGAAALAQELGRRVVESTAALPGIVRVTVALGVIAGLDADPTQPARLAAEQPRAVALLVEGNDVTHLQHAASETLREHALLEAGADSVLHTGLYRLQCAVMA